MKLGEGLRLLKRDVVALWLAARDPRVPWHAKLIASAIAAYALSPIDLIPDFIPVLGYLDDALIVPAGIWLALRLIPAPLIVEFRLEAARRAERPRSWFAALIIIVLVWLRPRRKPRLCHVAFLGGRSGLIPSPCTLAARG